VILALLLACRGPVDWAPCGAVECGTFDVPLDPDDPDGPTTTLALTRARARVHRDRIGTLVLHVGGPGEASGDALRGWIWPDGALAAQDPALSDDFDWLAVDWRGTGASSSAVHCLDEARWEALTAAPTAPRDHAEWQELAAVVPAFQAGCFASQPDAELAHVDTLTSARDLDLVREALGEDQLTLLTWSGGTRLAADYARLYPDHVRAAVLDSVVDMRPEADRYSFLAGQAVGFDDALVQFFDWCAGNDACAFGADRATGTDVAAAYDTLVAALNTTPVDGIDGASMGAIVLAPLYNEGWGFPWLGDTLAAAEAGDTSALVDARSWTGLPATAADDGLLSAYTAITALDLPAADQSIDDLEAFAVATAKVAPRSAAAVAAFDAFSFGWPLADAVDVPPSGPIVAPPLLLVATEHDPATPAFQAEDLRDALANGSHLLVQGGTGHAATARTACAGAEAARYLLDPTYVPAERCDEVVP
jgi:pimeloyl-ACP methyl ester carboxylesterase